MQNGDRLSSLQILRHRNSARIERRLDVVKSLYGLAFEIVYLVNENHSLATAVIGRNLDHNRESPLETCRIWRSKHLDQLSAPSESIVEIIKTNSDDDAS
jgi:hypothetical protein